MVTLLGVGAMLNDSLGIIGIIAFAGVVVVYLVGSKDKGTIETLERYSTAADKRLEQLEAASVRDAAEIVRLNARVAALEDENSHLRAERPSAEAIAEILSTVQATYALLSEGGVT